MYTWEEMIPQYRQYTRQCPVGSFPYAISPGDTLSSIARRFGTTVSALITANPGINPNSLHVGQIICISVPKQQGPACPAANYYVINRGDTLYAIARNFNVTVQQILSVNPNINPNALRAGQVICIPVAPSPVSITVDVNRKRLTVYRGGRVFRTYPVATGKPTTPTPIGTFTIANKQVNPGGPFGTRWLGLSRLNYGIHGTSDPSSIGRDVSNGCIRMYNTNVNELFNMVPVGTIVRIF